MPLRDYLCISLALILTAVYIYIYICIYIYIYIIYSIYIYIILQVRYKEGTRWEELQSGRRTAFYGCSDSEHLVQMRLAN